MDNIKTALELITELAFKGVIVSVCSSGDVQDQHYLPLVTVGLHQFSTNKNNTATYSSNIYRDEAQFVAAVKKQYIEFLKEDKHEKFIKRLK